MITVEKAAQKVRRKIRKVGSKALPDLLFIGTRGRGTAGRLDRVIDGLEQRLCNTITKGYPKLLAAANVEKRRSQEADIAAANAMAKSPASNSVIEPESEPPIALHKAEPLTDAKSAAKARKKAIKAKLKAEKAEASAAEARERLNKVADMDSMITIAKSIISGGADQQPGVTSKTLLREIKKRADAEFAGLPLTSEQRYSRFLSTSDGDILLKASRRATQEAFDSWDDEEDDEPADMPDENDQGYSKLARAARDLMAKDSKLTFQVAFARVYDQHPEWAHLTKSFQRQKIAKAGWQPASDGRPAMPSPGKGQKGDAAGLDAYQRLMELARGHRRDDETLEQCFARLYSSSQYSDLIKMQKSQHFAKFA